MEDKRSEKPKERQSETKGIIPPKPIASGRRIGQHRHGEIVLIVIRAEPEIYSLPSLLF